MRAMLATHGALFRSTTISHAVRSQPAEQLHVSLCEVDRDPTCGNCDVDRFHHGSGPQCACRCVGDGQWALVRSTIAKILKASTRNPLNPVFIYDLAGAFGCVSPSKVGGRSYRCGPLGGNLPKDRQNMKR